MPGARADDVSRLRVPAQDNGKDDAAIIRDSLKLEDGFGSARKRIERSPATKLSKKPGAFERCEPDKQDRLTIRRCYHLVRPGFDTIMTTRRASRMHG